LALGRIPAPEYDGVRVSRLFPVDVNRQRQEVIAVEGLGQEQVLSGELFELCVAQEAHEGALEMSRKCNPGGRCRSRVRG